MRYHALATDYDGTLAHHGKVDEPTLAALERLRATGRRLLLVTGRELEELLGIFPEVTLFEWVVAENGALLYRPADRQTKLLGESPPERFVAELRRRGVAPLSVGRSIVATFHPNETKVLETIRDLGLELQVIFNKDAVMVLPAGVNKATGLRAALQELGLSPHEVVGVGDAENDHAFLSLCECSAAVANALPALKDRADLVTRGAQGAGVAELIDRLVDNDLADLEGKIARHQLLLGNRADGGEERIPSYGLNLLIAGPSGSGKSTAATSLLERLAGHKYQFCIIDPEGDYEGLSGAAVLGNAQQPPNADEVLQLLADPDKHVVVNLIGLPLADRPTFFLSLLPRLQEMRARTGRPHWLLVDEAHHLLPAAWEPAQMALPQEMKRMAFVTVHPDQMSAAVLHSVDLVMAVGEEAEKTIAKFCGVVGERPPRVPAESAESTEVVVWRRDGKQAPCRVKLIPSKLEHHRHTRKYAEGELPPERSFYFQGPEGKLNLRAQNLILFLQMAEGVDDDTWDYHLRRGDISKWFRESIKDEVMAAEAAEVEERQGFSAEESRKQILEIVERHYTLPTSAPLPMPGTDTEPTRS